MSNAREQDQAWRDCPEHVWGQSKSTETPRFLSLLFKAKASQRRDSCDSCQWPALKITATNPPMAKRPNPNALTYGRGERKEVSKGLSSCSTLCNIWLLQRLCYYQKTCMNHSVLNSTAWTRWAESEVTSGGPLRSDNNSQLTSALLFKVPPMCADGTWPPRCFSGPDNSRRGSGQMCSTADKLLLIF